MKAPANVLANTADDVTAGLAGNPAFPAPPVSPAELALLNAALRAAITDWDAGGPEQTAAKHKASAAVANALRKNANYVEIESDHDRETLLSSGFTLMNPNHAQSPLPQPVIRKILNLATTQLLLRVGAIRNAATYQVQLATAADGPWQEAGIATQARRIVLTGLTPGVIYFVRVRAVGGSTGYSEWSGPVSLMAT